MVSSLLNDIEYQTFQVSSTTDAAVIEFRYPYQTDMTRYVYRLRLKVIDLQFTYRNILAPNNTITILQAPTGSVPKVLTIPEGAYDFSTIQLWWNAQNWQGMACTLGYSSVTNRIGIYLNTGSSIDISNVAKLFGSAIGTITNTSGVNQQYACLYPPQFAPFNSLLAVCDGVRASMAQNSYGNVVTGVVANISLSNANPGQYLHYGESFGGVEEYTLLNPSFRITITDDTGVKLALDPTLKTTIGFTLCIYKEGTSNVWT